MSAIHIFWQCVPPYFGGISHLEKFTLHDGIGGRRSMRPCPMPQLAWSTSPWQSSRSVKNIGYHLWFHCLSQRYLGLSDPPLCQVCRMPDALGPKFLWCFFPITYYPSNTCKLAGCRSFGEAKLALQNLGAWMANLAWLIMALLRFSVLVSNASAEPSQNLQLWILRVGLKSSLVSIAIMTVTEQKLDLALRRMLKLGAPAESRIP